MRIRPLAGRLGLALLLGVLPALPARGAPPAAPAAAPARETADVVERARECLARDRPAEAASLLRERLRETPGDAPANVALGDVERLRCRLEVAEAAYRRALERDLFDPGARTGLSEVLLLQGRPLEALIEAEAAIEGIEDDGAGGGTHPCPCPTDASRACDGRPWRMKALALVELRRYDLAVAAARRAASLSPRDAKCVESLAAALFRAGRMDDSRWAYERAVRLDPRTEEANLRLGNGFAQECPERPWKDGADAKPFAEAVAAFEEGRLDDAQDRFLALLERRPDDYKYRLGLGLVRLSLRRRNETYLGGDVSTLYAMLPAPEVSGLTKVVRGYESLTPLEALVVRVATAPARPFWDALVQSGATHDVMPIVEDLTDCQTRQSLVGRRTFDGRLYGHLRGVGGVQAATGAEKLLEAAGFGFNTFAHEFGHQVHRKGLTDAQQRDVDTLYSAALRENRCLDYYAASNADEYFAQGYEAFVSPLKRGCLTETARHTRDELKRHDPAFFALLCGILDTAHESPDAFLALASAASGTRGQEAAEPADTR